MSVLGCFCSTLDSSCGDNVRGGDVAMLLVEEDLLALLK